jgi:YHS domain-containing protein
MNKQLRPIVILAALAVILVLGVFAQQQSADKAVDPVCGMTVVKANAKATFDYKGTTYYFCSTGCKEAFAKEPEKYLKAQQAKSEAAKPGQMGHMGQAAPMGGQMGMMKHESMAGCPMGQGMPMAGRMGMMRGGRGPMMAPGLGQMFRLYGDKIEVAVENTKDGAVLKISSKDPEVVKAIQVHMAEHMAMMKKMAAAPEKESETGSCAGCPMTKK